MTIGKTFFHSGKELEVVFDYGENGRNGVDKSDEILASYALARQRMEK